MVTPRVRRALHEALDLVLDAFAEDARETPVRRRKRPEKARTMPHGVDEVTLRRAQEMARRLTG